MSPNMSKMDVNVRVRVVHTLRVWSGWEFDDPRERNRHETKDVNWIFKQFNCTMCRWAITSCLPKYASKGRVLLILSAR